MASTRPGRNQQPGTTPSSPLGWQRTWVVIYYFLGVLRGDRLQVEKLAHDINAYKGVLASQEATLFVMTQQ